MKRSHFSILKVAPVAILVLSATALGSPAPLPIKACITCGNSQKTLQQTLPLSNSAGSALSALQQSVSIAKIFNPQTPPIEFPTAPLGQESGSWVPGQDLPGSFKYAFSTRQTDFDPSFTTAYYSSVTGATIDVPSAPWNMQF